MGIHVERDTKVPRVRFTVAPHLRRRLICRALDFEERELGELCAHEILERHSWAVGRSLGVARRLCRVLPAEPMDRDAELTGLDAIEAGLWLMLSAVLAFEPHTP